MNPNSANPYTATGNERARRLSDWRAGHDEAIRREHAAARIVPPIPAPSPGPVRLLARFDDPADDPQRDIAATRAAHVVAEANRADPRPPRAKNGARPPTRLLAVLALYTAACVGLGYAIVVGLARP